MSTIEIRFANSNTYFFHSDIQIVKDCDNQYSYSSLSVALRKAYCDLIYSYWPGSDITSIRLIDHYISRKDVNTNTK